MGERFGKRLLALMTAAAIILGGALTLSARATPLSSRIRIDSVSSLERAGCYRHGWRGWGWYPFCHRERGYEWRPDWHWHRWHKWRPW